MADGIAKEDGDALKLDQDHSSISVFVMTQLLILTLIASYMLKRFKVRVVHETLVGLLLGMLVGLVSMGSLKMTFDNQYFFNLLLPPIILHSGWDMDVESFLRYFWRILLFAFIGTFISSFIVGYIMYTLVLSGSLNLTMIECFMYGSILSSTDPISVLAVMKNLQLDNALYTVIFGESVLNDAVSIVLYQTLDSFRGNKITSLSLTRAFTYFVTSFASSFLLGVGVALLCAFIIGRLLRGVGSVQYGGLEAAFVGLIAYSSYFLSNLLGLSGIVSLLFCGLTMKHYVQPTLSLRTKRTLGSLFQLTSQLSETFIFIYLGIMLFSSSYQNVQNQPPLEAGEDAPLVMVWRPVEIIVCFVGVLCGRAVVFPLSWLVNFIRRCKQVGFVQASADGFQWLTSSYAASRRFISRISSAGRGRQLLQSDRTATATDRADTIDNQQKRKVPISMAHQVVLWFCGLRGAIAFALSMDIKPSSIPMPPTNSTEPAPPGRTPVEEIRTTTLAVCVLTILILGGSIGFLVKYLDGGGRDRRNSTNNNLNSNLHDSPHAQPDEDDDEDDELDEYSPGLSWFRWLDEKFLRPLFVGKPTRYNRSRQANRAGLFNNEEDFYDEDYDDGNNAFEIGELSNSSRPRTGTGEQGSLLTPSHSERFRQQQHGDSGQEAVPLSRKLGLFDTTLIAEEDHPDIVVVDSTKTSGEDLHKISTSNSNGSLQEGNDKAIKRRSNPNTIAEDTSTNWWTKSSTSKPTTKELPQEDPWKS